MIKVLFLDNLIAEDIAKENAARESKHKSSGKLSASMLGNPLQWQILKNIGVPAKEFDTYTLRKFIRGRQVEDWLRSRIDKITEEEKFVEYRNTIGFIDAYADVSDWNIPNVSGTIPHEIKSVPNSQFRWIKKDGYKHNHALQTTLYALATGSDHFIIHYVASDDFRIISFLVKTAEYKQEVDKIIDTYENQLKAKTVPVFQPVEKWQGNIKYNSYPEWAELTQEEIDKKLRDEFPQAYAALMGETGETLYKVHRERN